MKKTLEEMLTESTAAPDAGKAARRRAIFLEYWGQMEEERRKGWSWLQIHNALFREGIVDYPYPTFMYYKDRRMKRKTAEAKPDNAATSLERLQRKKKTNAARQEPRRKWDDLFLRKIRLEQELEKRLQQIRDDARLTATVTRQFTIQVRGVKK